MFGATTTERAYFAPFLAFYAVLAIGAVVSHFFDGYAFWMVSAPRYWVCPVQTFVCGAFLIHAWRRYDLRFPRQPVFTIGVGLLVFILWVTSRQWIGWVGLAHFYEFIGGFTPRLDGFDPSFFGTDGWKYVVNLGLRFLRLVIVVPLVEEIFWRGFLLRYLIREDFTKVPMGEFSWLSFAIVTAGFVFEHSPPDWPAALLTGVLYNLVAYRTRSLSACVLAHAITNAALGIYILRTGQWGFW